MISKLILVGGFLGSGKTTLMAEAARQLTKQGKAVGLVTNDQATELVDTFLLAGVGKDVSELAGSCFCCNFSGFVDSIQSLIKRGAEIVIAEPVGSCTDLSATIVNPLKKFHPEWNLAPLSVLVDPSRLPEIFGKAKSNVDPDALYIMELQLAEADRIFVSKSDLLSDAEKNDARSLLEQKYPGKIIGFLSSKNGEGLHAWLTEVQSASDAGATIVPVDYARYAHGEAVLGWLNAKAKVKTCVDGKKLLTDLLTAFHAEIKKTNSEVGHVKTLLNLDGKEWVGNLTSLKGNVDVRDAESSLDKGVLIFNARVQTSPDALETLVRNLLEKFSIPIDSLQCFEPGYPTPTHRFAEQA